MVVETLGGEQQIDDVDEVAGYVEAMRLLLGGAEQGSAAIARIREVLRNLGE